MTTQKAKMGTGSLILIISTILILIVINVYSFRHFGRIDLTTNKEYTLSQSSKNIMERLDDVITIKAYFSKTLPPYLASIVRDVHDLVEEYRAYAKGNLQVEFIDPSSDPQLQQELRFKGIMQVPLSIFQKDRAEAINAYLAMLIQYESRTQAIPVILDLRNLEYEITSSILKVSEEEKTIGILTNNEDIDINRDFQRLRRELEKQYLLRDIRLDSSPYSLRNVDTLLVISPKEFKETELFQIDQFLMNGGKIIFLVDAIEMSKETLSASVNLPNISKLIEHYGVKINPNLVIDLNPMARSMATFNTGYLSLSLPYRYWVKSIKPNLSEENPIVNRLESIVFPWISSQEILENRVEGLEVTELARTTSLGKTVNEPFDLNPQQNFSAGVRKEDLNSYLLASAISGKFASYYADKEIPTDDQDDGPGAAPTENKTKIDESPETQIIVIANSRFIEDRHAYQQPTSLIFLQNAVDWMTLGNELIKIRTRRVTDRPIKGLSDAERATVKYLNIFGVSIIIIFYAILRMYFRGRKRKYYESILVSK